MPTPTKPKKPTEDTDSVQRILSEQLKNLLPSDDLAYVTMKVPQVLEAKPPEKPKENPTGPQAKLPEEPKPDFTVSLRPYRVLLGYSDRKEEPEHCQWAALCLYPGITERGAIEALKLLIKKFPAPTKNPKGGQTALSPARIGWIHQAFERCTNGDQKWTGRQWTRHYLKRAYDRQLSEWERSPHAQEKIPLIPRPKLEVLKPGAAVTKARMYRAIIGTFGIGLDTVKKQYKLWEAAKGKKPKTGR